MGNLLRLLRCCSYTHAGGAVARTALRTLTMAFTSAPSTFVLRAFGASLLEEGSLAAGRSGQGATDEVTVLLHRPGQ